MSIDLNAIQARADAATEGPWEWTRLKDQPRQELLGACGGILRTSVLCHPELPDAEFIAAARTDVPALLAYARDLEARLRRVEELADNAPKMQNMGGWSPGIVLASEIRAALTATEARA